MTNSKKELAQKPQTVKLEWMVETNSLFEEIMTNDQTRIMGRPLQIMYDLLKQVAKRAIELNDRELNNLMLRLSLYSLNDSHSRDFNPETVRKYLEESAEEKKR